MSNKFSLSHYKIFTGNMGKLIPTTWFPVNPGEVIKMSVSGLIRFAPLVAPVMHPVIIRFHTFMVPIRLIWDEFEDFITKGVTGTEEPEHPYRVLPDTSTYSGYTLDYLGVPLANFTGSGIQINALPLRAFLAIFNEYYRDKDLVSEATYSVSSGADVTTPIGSGLNKSVSWFADQFTSARPWEQRGDEVLIPLLGDAPVTGIGTKNQTFNVASAAAYETDGTASTTYTNAQEINSTSDNHTAYLEEDPDNAGYPNVRANLAAASGVAISDLRLASALQSFQERMAWIGGDYGEYLKSLGVRNMDARLQKPEYLGGSKAVMNISEVLATDGSNTGSMYGHGISAVRQRPFIKYIPEHSIIMNMMSVVPINMYGNGLDRHWFPETREDYLQPELQAVGAQEIYNKELYAEHSAPDGTFGFQPRYDEFRRMRSSIAGEIRSSLSEYTLARSFGSDPALNSSFINCSPSTDIFAAPTSDQLRCMVSHSIVAKRRLAKYPYTMLK